MTEDRFWRTVRVSTPYGKNYSAHITCKGYDYNEESTLEEGESVAKQRLFDTLKKNGHIDEPLNDDRADYRAMCQNSMSIGKEQGNTID